MHYPPFRHSQKTDPLTISICISLIITGILLVLFFWMTQSQNIFGEYGFSPHGFCFLWNTRLVALHVISDSLIGIAYVSISLTLTYFIIKLYHDLPFRWVFVAFGGFIVSCAMTHFFDVWTLWYATYWLSGTVKLITAMVSLSTAVLLPPLLPKVQGLIESAKISERLNEELHVSGERFKRFMNANIVGMVLSNEQGIFDTNEAFLNLIGYSREEVELHQMSWSLITPPEYEPASRKALEDLRTQGVFTPFEKTYMRKDGTQVPVLVGAALLQKEPLQWAAFVLDLSTQKMLEHQLEMKNVILNEQNQQIQHANQLKSEFMANMSHELRTPLNSIIGFSDLLLSEIPDPLSETQKDYLADMLSNGKHLLQLINDVLDLSKVEAGKMTFQPEPIDLTQLIKGVHDILRPLAAKKQMRIEVEIDPTVREIILDPVRFKQVLYNYLSNAIKFTPEEGTILVRLLPEQPETFRLEVQDTGIGIRPEDLNQLFVEFQQLDASSSKKYQGTGLGLALTRRLVEAQRGSVGVQSVQGKGSTFFAILPRVSQMSIEERDDSVLPKKPVAGTPCMLIIDAEQRDRERLAQICRNAGYNVESAKTGREAVDKCQQRHFDLITLDLILPDLDGWEVLHTIRAQERNRDVPIVVVTVVKEGDVEVGFEVQEVLTKPIRVNEIQQTLHNILGQPTSPSRE